MNPSVYVSHIEQKESGGWGWGGLRGRSWIAGAEGGESRLLAPTALSSGHSGRTACRPGLQTVENTAFGASGKETLFTVGGLQASLQPGMMGGRFIKTEQTHRRKPAAGRRPAGFLLQRTLVPRAERGITVW